MGTQDFIHLKGDTFKAHRFLFQLSNGSVYDFSNATVKIQLKRAFNDMVRLTLNTTINTQNTTTLDFDINENIIDIPAFNYIYDVQITMGDVVKTWLGGNFIIIDTVTE